MDIYRIRTELINYSLISNNFVLLYSQFLQLDIKRIFNSYDNVNFVRIFKFLLMNERISSFSRLFFLNMKIYKEYLTLARDGVGIEAVTVSENIPFIIILFDFLSCCVVWFVNENHFYRKTFVILPLW